MKLDDVAVATLTWVRSPAEHTVLAASLRCLAEAGMPIAVADRGSDPAFTRFLRSLPALHVCVPSEGGLVAQIQASMQRAATFGRRYILYVEPDKQLFFANALRGFLERLPHTERLGVALASRSADSFATFPPMQRFTEGVINQLCQEIIGRAGDYSYGPFAMNRSLLPHVAALDLSLGWGWRHSVFVAASRAKLDVLHIEGDYPCPPDQQHEDADERLHRMRQLSQNVGGLVS
jgi:hypothetical protein